MNISHRKPHAPFQDIHAPDHAVDSISFEVYEGEIFGFLGPNGAGKSTTISMLTTLLTRTSGTAEVVGHDIAKSGSKVVCVGVFRGQRHPDKHMTGYENLIFFARLQGVPRQVAEERVKELLDLVELSDAAHRKVGPIREECVGGWRSLRSGQHAQGSVPRRATLGLDVQTRNAIWDYIKNLKKEALDDPVPDHPLYG